ncbi:Putative acyl-CoA oxidase/dehydrogenase, central domain, acyl-CoA dehydrogenase/oxidase [Septoria linicola]|uniref:Acyl-CoA oxidase/dehydrogenase, central domain, acyl-CoA dehydrogenase/oxidase n=1 Tax=Septoria linicola TaxID=215465 RepID=A0A9Q9AKN1_9PEZI|nr:putative acyl-CoA oxidase/dehydrogenase, central domain, acyl-CoA dehydrogenase/oxidase [Septoria linicola]USW51157.1 Putative acyl-CoA oxidase/dehydrogenase, central domain, acyl-CoA dehydrogenase/oxidase [Septoria linicola]
MSVPYKIEASEELLVAGGGGGGSGGRASDRIPYMARPFVSDRAKKTLDLVEKFVEEECVPADTVYQQQVGQGIARFDAHPQVIEDLKKRARELGLWNLFLPKNHFKEGAGFSNLEYGLMAEYLGKSFTASEAVNCSAPDTGNMEVFAKYGTQKQKDRWLQPLLDGKIRSAFLMTEPDVASSDATNIELNMRQEGNEWVLNGSKWWSSGAGDKRCEVFIVMGKSDPRNASVYKQQSVIIVPFDAPGITIHRMLGVFGYDDAPHGHGHITFENVRVPAENMVLGAGRGFEVIQGRLGPGRIHHAMRSIGAAEKGLEYMIARMNDPRKTPFGKQLHEHGVMLSRVADARVKIDAARLQVCEAAIKIDTKDAKFALKEIAEAKILVPRILLEVLDDAIQAYGGAGVSQDTPLANMWAHGRTMRIVDGPDEVHMLQMGRNENKKGKAALQKIEWQKKKAEEMCRAYGMEKRDILQLDRKVAQQSKL